MKIESAFLANYAEVRETLVFASGAFPEWWTVEHLPSVSWMSLVIVLQVEAGENSQTFDWAVKQVDPYGNEILVAQIKTQRAGEVPPDGEPLLQSLVVALSVEFRHTGLHRFHVEGADEASISLGVRMAPRQ